MEINCIICSDLFTQSSEVVLNECGHMFHHSCLLKWLQRSKTCPQCRRKSTERSMYRVYFNIVNTEHIKDDVGALQWKLDNAHYKITSLNKDVQQLTETADSKEAQNIALKEIVSDLEAKIRTYESTILGLKEKINMYKIRSSEVDSLRLKIDDLQSALRDVEKVRTAIYGTRAEVTEILRNETNIEALALLSATLKKSLIDKENKATILQNRLRQSQNESMKYKRDFNNIDSIVTDLRKELAASRKSWEEEKSYLKQKIEELKESSNEHKSRNTQKMDTSVQRILTESPAPLPRRLQFLTNEKIENKSSPTVAENVLNIMESDSPYLNTKTNYSSIFNARYATSLNQKKSIFKPQSASLPTATPKPSTSETVYTGLGGQVSEDYFKFPDRKSSQTGLKRPKPSSAVPATKFRKLAPLALSRKITDFTK